MIVLAKSAIKTVCAYSWDINSYIGFKSAVTKKIDRELYTRETSSQIV